MKALVTGIAEAVGLWREQMDEGIPAFVDRHGWPVTLMELSSRALMMRGSKATLADARRQAERVIDDERASAATIVVPDQFSGETSLAPSPPSSGHRTDAPERPTIEVLRFSELTWAAAEARLLGWG